jgi:predicted ATPase
MKLRSLEIGSFKNLRNFKIDFGQNIQNLTSVVLGWNGTGKSNLLEALIIIFRDLDRGELTEFKYILQYECRQREIRIDSDLGRSRREQIKITVRNVDGSVISPSLRQFASAPERRYLPSYVFGYYSGPSNRMEKHFDKHQDLFYHALLRSDEQPARPLLYARPVHSQFALLSFFTEIEEELEEGETSMRDFLRDLLGVEKLVSVTFVLREPPWNWRSKRDGDPRFWNASGVVRIFAAQIFERAQAPMRLSKRITPEFANTKDLQHLHLYLSSVEKLQELAHLYKDQDGKYSPQEFFKALESTYISKILSEVRIQLQRSNADGSLTFRDMSEGEQQLLMVLGLLRFTKEDEALFLLDEPDTHLNPAWSVRYLDFMDQVVGNRKTSHVIMTTHNPLVVSALKRENVLIMQRKGARITADPPREDPQGMGVSNILTSELFGLRTTLDWPTQKKLDKQRELVTKEHRTPLEEQELWKLTSELDDMGFQLGEDDEIYAAFLKKWFAREDPALREQFVLTQEQREERERMMEQIIQELQLEGHWR